MSIYQGIAGSRGIAAGRIWVLQAAPAETELEPPSGWNPDKEQRRLQSALMEVKRALAELSDKTEKRLGTQDAEIFAAQRVMLDDPEIVDAILEEIASGKSGASGAVQKVIESTARSLDASGDEYLRARAADVRDVGRHLLKYLAPVVPRAMPVRGERYIYAGHDITPSETASLEPDSCLGFVSEMGSQTSHAVILARSMGLPAVVGAEGALNSLKTGDLVILDGNNGQILTHPTEAELADAQAQSLCARTEREQMLDRASTPAITTDGVTVEVEGNIGRPEEAASVLDCGGEGIGLFRSEFFYMNRSDFPSEEEQYWAYRAVAEAMAGRPVIIRTMDIGGDKRLGYFHLPEEMNPFLGYRALRISLNEPAAFKTQLRALLRAGCRGDVRIMFPMVSCIEEIRQAKALLRECVSELESEGIPCCSQPKTGIMVEIPAIALQAEAAAREVDFFSIGTNDLLQYSLAVDRMNRQVAPLYNPYHPGVLALLRHVFDAARQAGIPVGMCGEMAGDPAMTSLLLGLGLRQFSMSSASIPEVKALLRRLSAAQCRDLANRALELSTGEEVRNLVQNAVITV